jgi:hypothetical protein
MPQPRGVFVPCNNTTLADLTTTTITTATAVANNKTVRKTGEGVGKEAQYTSGFHSKREMEEVCPKTAVFNNTKLAGLMQAAAVTLTKQ